MIDRLRTWARNGHVPKALATDLSNAADEIERLKNELKREQIEGEESDRQIQHLLSANERLRNDHIAAHRISVATIDFLEGRLERLRAALKPFADMACELSARNWKDDRVVVALDNRDDPHRIVAKDFFDARQVLNQQITSEKEKT